MAAKVTSWNDTARIAKVIRDNALADARGFAEAVRDNAKRRAPVDTGALRDSIEMHAEGDRTFVVEVGQFYGAFVEYGTSRAPAQPFLTPAFEEERGNIDAHFGKRRP